MPPKASKSASEVGSYKTGDLVLGRIKGYPLWPAKIVDPETEVISKEVQKSKGKKAFLIKFYTDAQYSWADAKELQHLTSEAIDKFVAEKGGKKTTGALMAAYKTAQDPTDWEETQASKANTRREKREKGEEDVADEEEEEEESTTKKRKRPAKAASAEEKEKKKPKTETRTRESKAKEKKPTSKKTDLAEFPADGEKRCKEWRHKLQKAFLTDKGLPSKDEMPGIDAIYKDMETFEVKAEWLASSKIAKVLKRVQALPSAIPRDAEFNIKDRSAKLLDQWKSMTNEGPNGENGDKMDIDDEPSSAVPETATKEDERNGDEKAEAKETNGTTEEASAEATKETAEVSKGVEDAKIDDAPAENAEKPAETAEA